MVHSRSDSDACSLSRSVGSAVATTTTSSAVRKAPAEARANVHPVRGFAGVTGVCVVVTCWAVMVSLSIGHHEDRRRTEESPQSAGHRPREPPGLDEACLAEGDDAGHAG